MAVVSQKWKTHRKPMAATAHARPDDLIGGNTLAAIALGTNHIRLVISTVQKNDLTINKYSATFWPRNMNNFISF